MIATIVIVALAVTAVMYVWAWTLCRAAARGQSARGLRRHASGTRP